MLDKIYGFGNKVVDLIYPSNIYCISCGNIVDNTRPYSLCDSCLRTFHWLVEHTCEKCGKPLREIYEQNRCSDCITTLRCFHRGYSCVEYGESERKLIHRFKYKEDAYLMKPMADAMFDRIAVENLDVDLIVPVPMYARKEAARGYNQAHLLGKKLAKSMGVAYEKNVLLRVVETEAMSGLGLEERKANIKNAFAVSKDKKTFIKGKKILIIDDIFTTGCTADECASVLLSEGASNASIYAFAAGK